MSDKSILLIDELYRYCFDKREPNVELRTSLQAARRFVLDDGMTEFLIDLVWQNMFGRVLRQSRHGQPIKPAAVGKRTFRMLDNMRYFSRLPHRITWFEFSAEAFTGRQLDIAVENKIGANTFVDAEGNRIDKKSHDEILESCKGVRFGWLMRQIGQSETSFDCTSFTGGHGPHPTVACCSTMWDTETNVLPLRLEQPLAERGYDSGSELATGMRGYKRDNVGFRICGARDHGVSLIEYRSDIQASMRDQFGRLRYVWVLLSTLNKIPLTGERVIKPSRGFLARGTYRKFLEHTMITLTVPQKQRAVFARKVLGEIARRRAHQVRGHWRDDWHQPKGNKALWIAEHQRGDASLGFVTHDYEVRHEQT